MSAGHYKSRPYKKSPSRGSPAEREFDVNAAKGRGCYTCLQTAKHVLNPIAFLVSPFVVLDGLTSRCPSWDERCYPLFNPRLEAVRCALR